MTLSRPFFERTADSDYRRAWAERLAREEEVVQEKRPYLLFELNQELFALSLDSLLEVLKKSSILPLPGSDTKVLGLVNVRGRLTVCISLSRLLGQQPGPHSQHFLLLENKVVIPVGKVLGTLDLAEESLSPVHSSQLLPYSTQVESQGPIRLLDPVELQNRIRISLAS